MIKKILLIILLSSLSLFISGQYFDNEIVKPEKGGAVKVIALYSTSILFEAIGDGLNDSGEKGWGHLCNAASVGILLISPFIIDYEKSKIGWYLASYVSLRIALFDYSYNLIRGLPLNYIGGTSTWDKVLKEVNPHDTYMGRGVFFIVGITIPINKIK